MKLNGLENHFLVDRNKYSPTFNQIIDFNQTLKNSTKWTPLIYYIFRNKTIGLNLLEKQAEYLFEKSNLSYKTEDGWTVLMNVLYNYPYEDLKVSKNILEKLVNTNDLSVNIKSNIRDIYFNTLSLYLKCLKQSKYLKLTDKQLEKVIEAQKNNNSNCIYLVENFQEINKLNVLKKEQIKTILNNYNVSCNVTNHNSYFLNLLKIKYEENSNGKGIIDIEYLKKIYENLKNKNQTILLSPNFQNFEKSLLELEIGNNLQSHKINKI